MSGRYPLRPGRPRIYRRRPGAWAFECHCMPLGRALTTVMPNIDSHQEAIRKALLHIEFWHIDPLERLFQLPAHERSAGGTR